MSYSETHDTSLLLDLAKSAIEKENCQTRPSCDLDSSCIFQALINPTKEWEHVIPTFCKMVFNEADFDDVQHVVHCLCDGLDPELTEKSMEHVFEIRNYGKDLKFFKQIIKYECLLILLPKETFCNLLNELCPKSQKIQQLVMVCYEDKVDDFMFEF